MFVAFGSLAQMDLVLSQKAVWVKHRDSRFLPPYAQVGGCAESSGQPWLLAHDSTRHTCPHAAALWTLDIRHGSVHWHVLHDVLPDSHQPLAAGLVTVVLAHCSHS